ncbi:hypothetical protein H0H93_013121, partial [Arthromyces matolae]
CDKYPPPDGEFLEIPANGNFTVQIATNRAFTTLSFDGAYTSDWTDGQPHLDAFDCTINMMDSTPWKRLTTYSVPDLPACPADGCICAWGWVPNG